MTGRELRIALNGQLGVFGALLKAVVGARGEVMTAQQVVVVALVQDGARRESLPAPFVQFLWKRKHRSQLSMLMAVDGQSFTLPSLNRANGTIEVGRDRLPRIESIRWFKRTHWPLLSGKHLESGVG